MNKDRMYQIVNSTEVVIMHKTENRLSNRKCIGMEKERYTITSDKLE